MYENPVDLFSMDSLGYNYTTYGLEYGLFTQCNSLSDKYEFGYNGQMKLNELAGIGNHNTALFWEYSPQVGRRWNRDPKYKMLPGMSAYSTNGDNPISNKDPNGDIFGVDNLVTGAIGAGVGALISLGKAVHEGGWNALKDGKTWAHAGVAAAEGGLIGVTQGASLLVVGGVSAAGSIVDDAIDGKLQNKKQWTGALIKAGAKGVLSAATAGLLKNFDFANEAIGEVSKPLMYVVQTKAVFASGLIDSKTDEILDPKINGWQEGYIDPMDGSAGILWHKGLVDRLYSRKHTLKTPCVYDGQ